MNTASKWSGFVASFFSIVTFAEGMAYAFVRRDMPDWFAILTAACFSLGALSGVVCLSTAAFGHFRRRRNGDVPPGADEIQPWRGLTIL